MNAAGILGTGTALPDRIVTNHDLEKMVETSDRWITERTGIKERRQAAPGVKVTLRNFGRDRRYPITNAFRDTV